MTSVLNAFKATKLLDAHRLKNQLLQTHKREERHEDDHPMMIFLLWFAAFSQALHVNPLIPVPSMA